MYLGEKQRERKVVDWMLDVGRIGDHHQNNFPVKSGKPPSAKIYERSACQENVTLFLSLSNQTDGLCQI